MPDEKESKPGGGIFGAKSGEGNPSRNAAATTSPAEVDGVKAEVSDAEAEALQGAAGPNRTPAFTKRDFEDENVQLTDTDDLQSAKQGAAASSAPATLDMGAIEALDAAGQLPEGAENEVQFTSTPIARLRVGRFQFENGVLRLKAGDAEEFRKLLGKSAIRTQQVVREIDRAGGEAVARRYIEQTQSRSTREVDTSDNAPPAARPQ